VGCQEKNVSCAVIDRAYRRGDERVNELRRNVAKVLVPSFEEGAVAPIKKMLRYLGFGAAGEVQPLLQQDSDLPRCALS